MDRFRGGAEFGRNPCVTGPERLVFFLTGLAPICVPLTALSPSIFTEHRLNEAGSAAGPQASLRKELDPEPARRMLVRAFVTGKIEGLASGQHESSRYRFAADVALTGGSCLHQSLEMPGLNERANVGEAMLRPPRELATIHPGQWAEWI